MSEIEPPSLSRWVRRIRWRLRSRRCICGAMRLAGDGSTAELAGVKHRTDGPCFHCDTYGEPL
jgi:hypothetical protein